jgi:hypothetical protein
VSDAKQLSEWRTKVDNGTITVEELTAAIAVLREGRRGAEPKPKEPKPKRGAKAPHQVDLEELINQQL